MELEDIRKYDPIPVRVNEVGVDPALARAGDLMDVKLSGRQQHLAIIPANGIPIDVGIGKNVVRAQRLRLRDGVMKWPPVPQAHVFQQVVMAAGIDGGVRIDFEFDFVGTFLNSESAARGMN